MTAGSGSDRFGIIVAVLGGLFVALATVLVVLLISHDGGGTTTTAAAGTTAAETTPRPHHHDHSAPPAPPRTTTTAATTTTTAATTTTTPPPFEGTLDDKRGAVQGSPAGRLSGIRSADHPGFARVVFDFPDGGIPGFWVGYTDATTLRVILTAMDTTDPYDPASSTPGGATPSARAASSPSATAAEGAAAGSGCSTSSSPGRSPSWSPSSTARPGSTWT